MDKRKLHYEFDKISDENNKESYALILNKVPLICYDIKEHSYDTALKDFKETIDEMIEAVGKDKISFENCIHPEDPPSHEATVDEGKTIEEITGDFSKEVNSIKDKGFINQLIGLQDIISVTYIDQPTPDFLKQIDGYIESLKKIYSPKSKNLKTPVPAEHNI